MADAEDEPPPGRELERYGDEPWKWGREVAARS